MTSRRGFFRKTFTAVPAAVIGSTLLSRRRTDGFIERKQFRDGLYGYETVGMSITNGGGTGAKAQAFVVDGQVVGIMVTDPGRNYTSIPDVRFV